MTQRSSTGARASDGQRALALVLCVFVTGSVVPAAESISSDTAHIEPVDDVLPGEDSSHRVCDAYGQACVEASLHSEPFTCMGTDPVSFQCNVTYWLNLTLTSTGPVCANASTSATSNASPEACTQGASDPQTVTSGPRVVSYNMSEDRMVVNVTGEVCLENTCEAWDHDPILLPSWEEWKPGEYEPASAGGSTTNHLICLGDSPGFTRPGDTEQGCIRTTVISSNECDGNGVWYRCDVFVQLEVEASVPGLCGSLKSSFIERRSNVVCRFHGEDVELSPFLRPPRKFETAQPVVEHFEWPELHPDGPTLVIEAEACAWSFRYGAETFCETFHHVHRVPGEGGNDLVDFVFNPIVEWGNYVDERVLEHPEAPVSVYP